MKKIDYWLYGLTIFCWSTSWLPLKYQTGIVPPEISVFWRFFFAIPVMLLLFAGARKGLFSVGLSAHLRMALLGFCLFSNNFILFYYAAEIVTASGLLSVVFSTAALINVLLVALIARKMPSWALLFAVLIGIAGVMLIFLPEISLDKKQQQALFLCLAGTIFFCSGNLVSARLHARGIPIAVFTVWGMIYGAVYLGLFSYARGRSFAIPLEAGYLLSLAWTVIIASVLSFFAYLTLLTRIGPERAGYATIVFPVFALLISTAFEDYSWSGRALAGLLLVMVGNVVMLRIKNK